MQLKSKSAQRRISRPFGLSVFNPDNSSDEDESVLMSRTPVRIPLPNPTQIPQRHTRLSNERHQGIQSQPLQHQRQAREDTTCSTSSPFSGVMDNNTPRPSPGGAPLAASSAALYRYPTARNRTIITATADAENHVIVDITGAKNAEFIRERMFAKVGHWACACSRTLTCCGVPRSCAFRTMSTITTRYSAQN